MPAHQKVLLLPGGTWSYKRGYHLVHWTEKESCYIFLLHGRSLSNTWNTPWKALSIYAGYVFSETWHKSGNVEFTQWRNHVEVHFQVYYFYVNI